MIQQDYFKNDFCGGDFVNSNKINYCEGKPFVCTGSALKNTMECNYVVLSINDVRGDVID